MASALQKRYHNLFHPFMCLFNCTARIDYFYAARFGGGYVQIGFAHTSMKLGVFGIKAVTFVLGSRTSSRPARRFCHPNVKQQGKIWYQSLSSELDNFRNQLGRKSATGPLVSYCGVRITIR